MIGGLKSGAGRTLEAIDKVPSDEVGRVTQDFRDSGAEEIRVEPNADGTWKVIATFQD